jgi:hypothetical protein
MKELEKILALVQSIENDLVEEGRIEEPSYYTSQFEQIKEILYKEATKQDIK